MTVDPIGRTVVPAGIKQSVMPATTDFGAFGFSGFSSGVFYAGATFYVRLFACHFVSHNCCPFCCYPVLRFAATPLDVAAGLDLMSIPAP